MKKVDPQTFISMVSLQLKHIKYRSGKKIYHLNNEELMIYSIQSGIYKLKHLLTGKTVSFLKPGDVFYFSSAKADKFFIEEHELGKIEQVSLSNVLDYSAAKGVQQEVILYLFEKGNIDVSCWLVNRINAREEVLNLKKIYLEEPQQLREAVSVNSFIESCSFLSRGTISRELQILKKNHIKSSVRE